MKLDPVFQVKDNKLYKISDNTEVKKDSFIRTEIKWSTVELQDEAYNEEYLAELREQLKKYDDQGKFALLVPVIDKELKNQDQLELFINAFNHTARRIKDCVSVAGFELPESYSSYNETAVTDFIESLSKKHAQYIYFVNDKILSSKE